MCEYLLGIHKCSNIGAPINSDGSEWASTSCRLRPIHGSLALAHYIFQSWQMAKWKNGLLQLKVVATATVEGCPVLLGDRLRAKRRRTGFKFERTILDISSQRSARTGRGNAPLRYKNAYRHGNVRREGAWAIIQLFTSFSSLILSMPGKIYVRVVEHTWG